MSAMLRYLLTAHWAMETDTMDRMCEIMNRHFSGTKLSQVEIADAIGRDPAQAHPAARSYEVRSGVAIIPVIGVLAKYSADVESVSGPQGTSAEAIQRDLRAASVDPSVGAIVLAIHSPGGTVDGIPDTAALIADLGSRIPVVSHLGDMAASGGLWLGVSATKVYANANALIGSIGVITRLTDTSALADKAGVKVHVVRSTPLKAAGQPGEAVTPAQVAETQRVVDGLHGLFVSAVATGRHLSAEQVAKVATGQLFLPAQAQALGLIDGVMSLEALITQLSTNPTSILGKPMKITSDTHVKLLATHREHIDVIQAAVAADKDEPTILGLIAEEKVKVAVGQVAALRTQLGEVTAKAASDLTAANTAHAATKTELEQMTAKHAALAKLGAETPKDVGGDATKTAGGLSGEAKWKAEFAASEKLQDEYGVGGEAAYIANMKYDAEQAKKKKG